MITNIQACRVCPFKAIVLGIIMTTMQICLAHAVEYHMYTQKTGNESL